MKDLKRNLTMLCDYYELTMANGYFNSDIRNKIVYFDVFYRDNPDNGGYAIAAGLEQVVEYINDLHFDEVILSICAQRAVSQRDFLNTSKNLSSAEIFGQYPRER